MPEKGEIPLLGPEIKSQKGAALMYSSAYVWAKILIYLEERMTSTIVSTFFDDAEIINL